MPAGKWSYFALDGIPYHGHLLTLFYDSRGTRYKRGMGLHILCDGHEIAKEPTLAPVVIRLP
jgi:hypothetical protein